MKIAILALTDFHTFPIGGILTFVRRFVQAAEIMDDVETVLIGWSPEVARGPLSRRVSIRPHEYDFFPIGHGRLQSLLPDRVQFYMHRGRWSEVLEAVGHVDAYYCHSPEAVLRADEMGCGAPIALHIHGAVNTVGRSRFALARMRWVAAAYEGLVLAPALKAATAVFATISDLEFAGLQRKRVTGKNSFCVRVPAMVNRHVTPSLSRVRNGVLRLVSVGRLEAIKGVDLLIRVIAELDRRGAICELRIVGDGTARHKLEQLTERLNLQGRVRFLGTLSEQDVQCALSEADIFVSGSHQEGFSLALLEALAQGLPAVVTDVGSARDVIRDGVTGYVIDRRDVGVFAERVIAAAAHAGSMREQCVRAAEPYSSEVVSATIVDTLRRIASDGEFESNTKLQTSGGRIARGAHP